MRTEYKNALATKRKIEMTYLRLLADSKKNFSVTDIVQLAKINRGTFYLHFNNKQEVDDAIYKEISSKFKAIENNLRMFDIDQAPETVFNQINQIIKQDLEIFKLVADASENENLYDLIKTTILTIINNNFKVMQYIFNMEHFTMVCQYIVGGILTTYKSWFNKQISCSLDDLSAYLSRLIKDGLKGCIRYDS